MSSSTDRIEKEIVLRAPRSRVWRAVSDAHEFGEWFGLNFAGNRFVAGEITSGRITFPGYEHVVCEMKIEHIEPERLFSYRWHPYAIDPAVDYSNEPTTLVEFELEEVDGGTRLRLVESGFDRIPEGRRAEAFRMNSGGWDAQAESIAKHVSEP
jgi:uncharacterized protein YndB with AHSA1/START domain